MESSNGDAPVLLSLLLLPFFGFLVNGLIYPIFAGGFAKTKTKPAGTFASAVMLSSFFLAIAATTKLGHEPFTIHVYDWLQNSFASIRFDLYFDHLSALMVLLITGIGTLIHIYSIGYMEHEEGAARFFAYLNLFCFAMLVLVLSDNLLLLFFGWEGVGLCSYLLIAYWYKQNSNVDAARKAFLVNRLGDCAFLLAIFFLFAAFGTTSIAEIHKFLGSDRHLLFLLVGCLFFFAATGKSAQFPLYIWLPDAMAGPTPVSALIHAATMVTAGIYLFARMSGFFESLPELMIVIAYVGIFTSIASGIFAITQNDIKKVLAYSTISQLGFMFLGIGVGAYDYAMFHLLTHAFFKALLFLGAGSIIHGLAGEQNMENMGGLRKYFYITYPAMLIGCLALTGLPFFSGFFSKDGILFAALASQRGGFLLFFLGLFSAFLTAIYAFRMLKMVFFGTFRGKKVPHESSKVMTLPLLILALFAALGGIIGLPEEWSEMFGAHSSIFTWLKPSLQHAMMQDTLPLSESVVSVLAVFVTIVGFCASYLLFRVSFRLPSFPLRTFSENLFYVDAFYMRIFVRPFMLLCALFANLFEQFIQSFGQVVAVLTSESGAKLRRSQNGNLQWYALQFAIGVTLFAAISFWWTSL